MGTHTDGVFESKRSVFPEKDQIILRAGLKPDSACHEKQKTRPRGSSRSSSFNFLIINLFTYLLSSQSSSFADFEPWCKYPPPHMQLCFSSYASILLLICRYPPPHMQVSSSSYASILLLICKYSPPQALLTAKIGMRQNGQVLVVSMILIAHPRHKPCQQPWECVHIYTYICIYIYIYMHIYIYIYIYI